LRSSPFSITCLGIFITGCGAQADRPDNIPKQGQWSDQTRVVSVRANGTAFDRNLLPANFLPKEISTQSCVEPYIRGDEEIRQSLDSVLVENCVFTGIKRFGPRVSNTAQCSVDDDNGTPVRATLKYEAEEKPDRLEANASIDIYMSSPGGATQKVTIEMKREMIRTGDC
jgi:hypothetical protein